MAPLEELVSESLYANQFMPKEFSLKRPSPGEEEVEAENGRYAQGDEEGIICHEVAASFTKLAAPGELDVVCGKQRQFSDGDPIDSELHMAHKIALFNGGAKILPDELAAHFGLF